MNTEEPAPSSVLFRGNEKAWMYCVTGALLLIVVCLIVFALISSRDNYVNAIDACGALAEEMNVNPSRPFRPDVPMLYAMQYSRSYDAAVVKYGAVFLGFLIVILGSCFVVYGAQSFYRLRLANSEVKSALETSSPGLVMISLGTLLVIIAIFNKASFDTEIQWNRPLASDARIDGHINEANPYAKEYTDQDDP